MHASNSLKENGAHVEELYLKENQIEELPSRLATCLTLLTNIYLCKNNLINLPQSIGDLKFLTVLDLSKVGSH